MARVRQLTDDCGFEIDHDGSGYVLSGAGLAEEGTERVVTEHAGAADVIVGHRAVSADSVLHAVQLPARVADLHTSLAHVDGDTLALQKKFPICMPASQPI